MLKNIDIHSASEAARKSLTVCTADKFKLFLRYCYGEGSFEYENSDKAIKRYFFQRLNERFNMPEFTDASLAGVADIGENESNEKTYGIFITGFYAGYIAAVADTDNLHNAIEIPANTSEKGKS